MVPLTALGKWQPSSGAMGSDSVIPGGDSVSDRVGAPLLFFVGPPKRYVRVVFRSSVDGDVSVRHTGELKTRWAM